MAISETIKVKLLPKHDLSTKEYEIQKRDYRFDKYTRKFRDSSFSKWHHHRYYKTLSQAEDAIRDFRNSWYDKAYYDYPGFGSIENEKKYSHIKPTISIFRYRIVKREFI